MDQISQRLGLSRLEFFGELSLEIARAFDARRLSFDAADMAMNDLWAIAVCNDEQLPPMLEAVYNAFDAGELAIPILPKHDPIETLTRPMIKKIIAEA